MFECLSLTLRYCLIFTLASPPVTLLGSECSGSRGGDGGVDGNGASGIYYLFKFLISQIKNLKISRTVLFDMLFWAFVFI